MVKVACHNDRGPGQVGHDKRCMRQSALGGLGNQSGELFECKHFVLLVLVFPKQVPDGVLDIFAVTVLV